MSSSLRFDGLDELRAALRALPSDLAVEASHLVEGAANAAAAEIKAGYKVWSGNLRDHLYVTHQDKGRYGAGAIVTNTAKHAWVYDNGSAARHYTTRRGRRHATGAMPPTHLFTGAMIRHRRQMYDGLKAMLERNGLAVSGDA